MNINVGVIGIAARIGKCLGHTAYYETLTLKRYGTQ